MGFGQLRLFPWLTRADAVLVADSRRKVGDRHRGVCTYTGMKMGCTLEGVIFLFLSNTSSQADIPGIRAGPPRSKPLRTDTGSRVQGGGSERPPKEPAPHSTRGPSGSSPPNPVTCLRNCVLPTLPGPCWPAALNASRRGPERCPPAAGRERAVTSGSARSQASLP